MPTAAVSTRPQTLKQARRAYQKAGAQTRLSERQLRQLERSAELQERADRIKERENRRKANLKKRNEKIEREREARARMGIPSPVKEDVGASQMRLGKFLAIPMGVGLRCAEVLERPASPNCHEELLGDGPPPSAQKATPNRSPLRSLSGNGIVKVSSQKASLRKQSPRPLSAMPPPPRPALRAALIEQNGSKCTGQSPLGRPKMASTTAPSKPYPEKPLLNRPVQQPRPTHMHPPCIPQTRPTSATTRMPPPPLPSVGLASKPTQVPRQPLPLTRTSSTSKPTPMPLPPLPIHVQQPPPTKPTLPRSSKPPLRIPPPPKAPPTIDEWAAFLVSNTQIEREIYSPPPTITTLPHPAPKTPSLFLSQSSDDAEPLSTPCPAPTTAKSPGVSTDDLLGGICTQDLLDLGEDELEPPASETGVVGGTHTHTAKGVREQEFGDDITDGDLEGAVAEAELSASGGPEVAQGDELAAKPKATDSFCDDEFDFSTQELRELVD